MAKTTAIIAAFLTVFLALISTVRAQVGGNWAIGPDWTTPIPTAVPTITASPIGVTEIVLLVIFLFFVTLSYVTLQPFIFGVSAFISIILGIDLALSYLNQNQNWIFGIVGFALVLFGFWQVVAAFQFSTKKAGGKGK